MKQINREGSRLYKSVTRIDDLTNGYHQITTLNLYIRPKKGDHILQIHKVATDPQDVVFDVNEYFYCVDEDFVKKFNHKYNELDIMSRKCVS